MRVNQELMTTLVDPATELATRLVREELRVNIRSPMVEGHPTAPPMPDAIIRSAFFYGVVITPEITVLHDSRHQDWAYQMAPEEWKAVWRTPDLLAALGTDYEALRDRSACLTEAPIPAPILDEEDLDRILICDDAPRYLEELVAFIEIEPVSFGFR